MRTFAKTAGIGLGVIAISLFGATAPAVAAGAPTRTIASTSTPSVGIGEVAKLKAVVKPVSGTALPPGTVTFREGTTVLGTATLALVGTAQTARLDYTFPVGSHSIVATYNGSGTTWEVSTSLPITVSVGRLQTTTTATTSTPTAVLGQTARVKAVVKPVSGTSKPAGTIEFKEGTTSLGSVNLALVGTAMTATFTSRTLALGSHNITATYSGSTGHFGSVSSAVTVTVTKGSTTSTVTTTADPDVAGRTTLAVLVKPVAPATGVPAGNVTFVVDSLAPQVLALGATGRAQIKVTFAVGSTHTVRVSYEGSATFLASTGTATFTS